MPELSTAPEMSAATAQFLQREHKLFINNSWMDASTEPALAIRNPADGQLLASACAAGAAEVDLAVKAAREAFDRGPWRSIGATARAELLLKLAELVEQHAQTFSEIEVLTNGMPISTAGAVAPVLARDWLRYYAGWTTKIAGETLAKDPLPFPGAATDSMLMTRKEAIGVAAQIIPWNYPLGMSILKLGPALAAGCTVVLKPDEQTPLSALLLAELINQAGFPEGVVNIVPGRGEVAGAALAEHPLVDKISFTGSTEVGRQIVQAAQGNLKKVTLELGGKSPFVVMPDADLNKAIPMAVMQGYFLQGQNCVCPSRMLVHHSVYQPFLEGVKAGAENLSIGPGLNPQTLMGPLISEAHRQRVQNYIDSAHADGATLITGGKALDGHGNFMQPTLFADTDNTMKIVREEIFGPVLSVIKLDSDDPDEVIAMANDTAYGLNASVWTENITTAMRLSEGIRSGMVGINAHTMSDIHGGLGGYKQSGWGREMGSESLDAYLESKTVITHY